MSTESADALSTGLHGPNRVVMSYSVLLVVGLAGLLWFARSALAPFIFAMVLVYIMLPAVNRVESWLPARLKATHRRIISVLAVAGLGTVVAAILLTILAEPLVRQTQTMMNDLDTSWSAIGTRYPDVESWYTDKVPEPWRMWLDDNLAAIGTALWNACVATLSWLLNLTGSVVSSVLSFVTIPLFTIYYLIDERSTPATLRRQFPRAWADEAVACFRIFDRVFGSYTRGVLIESVLVGFITGAGYWIIGVDLFLPLGVIAMIGEIVPIVGPWMAFFISFPVVLTTQPHLALPAIALFLIIQGLEGWFLAPMIQGDANDLTNAGTLVILAVGGALAGGIGVVLALPAATLIRALSIYGYHRLNGVSSPEALATVGIAQTEQPQPDDDPARTG